MSVASIDSIFSLVLQNLWRATWQASILAGLVLAIQSILTRRLGGRGRYLLWSVVLLRLLLPALPQSRLSVFNVATAPVVVSEGRAFKSEIANPSVVHSAAEFDTEPSPQPSSRVQEEGVRGADFTLRAVFIAWLVGITLLSIRVMLECIRTWRVVRGLGEVSDSKIQGIVEACASSLDLRRLPRVVSGEAIQTPAVVGLWRPVLLLPSHVLEHCDHSQISMIVMHELAHLKRHDIAGNWLVTIATVIHWFNPLVWLMAARIRADRELACDELVLSRAGNSGCNVQSYGNTLLALVELVSPAPAQRQLVGILESSAPLERRIRMIARFDPKASGRWAWPVVIVAVLGIAFLTDAVNGQGRGQRSEAPATPATQPGGSPIAALTDEQVAAQLNKVLPEVRFDNIALSDVMEFMRDVSSANLVVEWRRLEMAGIDRNAQVSMRLRNVSVAQALDHILRDAGGGELNYHVQSGAIVVSVVEGDPTPQSAKQTPTETVFYDVNDLIGGWRTLAERDAQMKSLSEAIETTVYADISQLNQSRKFNIKGFGDKLIISTTLDGHQEVRHILAKLREKPSTQPKGSST